MHSYFLHLLLLILALLTWNVQAHDNKMVHATMHMQPEAWTANISLEAWMHYPEGSPKSPSAENLKDFAGSAWLATLDDNDYALISQDAEKFIRQTFLLEIDGSPLPYTLEFPELAAPRKPLLITDDGQAIIHIALRGKFPPTQQGRISLNWSNYNNQALALSLNTFSHPASLLLIPVAETTPLIRVPLPTHQDSSPEAIHWTLSLRTWLKSGFIHILPKGLDHIAFIIGLFLLQPVLRPLLWQTTTFTIAHTITLALATLGVIKMPASLVEVAIALSILYIGVENIWSKEVKPQRLAIIFLLGLLHGLGFANVLSSQPLPSGAIVLPLICFNIGVEAGQIVVLLAAFLVCWPLAKKPYYKHFRHAISLIIAGLGLFWTIQRML